MNKNTKVEDKSTELVSILKEQFQGKLNLARIKFLSLFIVALCKVQTVNFEKLSSAFNSTAKASSSHRRIQRFIGLYNLCPDLVARLIFSLLPKKEKLVLTIDRTNWKFGKTNINIFMLGVAYKGLSFPVMFSLLNKRGNSNSSERIDLVKRFINLFGQDCIDCLVADREFVGESWLEFLNEHRIRYYIRIRNNFKLYLPYKSKEVKANWLFNSLDVGQFKHYSKLVRIGDQLCYISGCKIKGKDGKIDFLIIASFNKPDQAKFFYEKRWQIETCFKAMKSSGFDIEKTHLSEIPRLQNLILLVMLAFVWCYKVGIFLHYNVNKVKTKKHGRKAMSLFKYGLKYIASVLLNPVCQDDIHIEKFLSCT